MRSALVPGAVLATLLLLCPPGMAKGRTASTTYRTRLGGVLPLTIKNINHSYDVGRGYMSIGKGQRYRVGLGRLTVGVSRGLGARLDRWMFNRFVFSKKNVKRTTRASDGVTEVQWGKKMLTINQDGSRLLSDYKRKVDVYTARDGKTRIQPHQPSGPGIPITRRQVHEMRDQWHTLPEQLRAAFNGAGTGQ